MRSIFTPPKLKEPLAQSLARPRGAPPVILPVVSKQNRRLGASPAGRRISKLVARVVQNEVLQHCVIPAKAGIQSPGTRGQVWMPAFAGMTLALLSHPPILNDSRG
jgi:hypothetical protein